jgi:hypothetical protein
MKKKKKRATIKKSATSRPFEAMAWRSLNVPFNIE